MTFLLFNIRNRIEWEEILMPSIKLLFSNKQMLLTHIDRGYVHNINFENNTIAIYDDNGNIIHYDFIELTLLDENNNRLQEKTEMLAQLHNHLFLN